MKKNNSLLRADNISWSMDGSEILTDISLHVSPGELLGVIGPNGAGKSSLLKILANVITPDAGELSLNNSNYRDMETRQFASTVAYLEQNPPTHWPLLVHKLIALGRIPYQGYFRKLSQQDSDAINSAINATGISHLLDRVVTTLSEGEKMLVQITRLLASEPQLIIADEPVATLDPYHQLLIMEVFHSLIKEQQNFSAIIVLHDLNLAAQFCDRLALLNNGSIVSTGKPNEVLTQENLLDYYRINADIDTAKNRVIPVSRSQ